MKKTPSLPDTLPLATLCTLLAEDERQIRRITQKAGIEIAEKGMYPVAGTIRAVVNHYEAKAADASEARADRARRVKNAADISEIVLAEKMNLYMLKSDFVEIPRDWIVAARRAIQDAPHLPEKAKLAVMEILQSSKLNDLSRG